MGGNSLYFLLTEVLGSRYPDDWFAGVPNMCPASAAPATLLRVVQRFARFTYLPSIEKLWQCRAHILALLLN